MLFRLFHHNTSREETQVGRMTMQDLEATPLASARGAQSNRSYRLSVRQVVSTRYGRGNLLEEHIPRKRL